MLCLEAQHFLISWETFGLEIFSASPTNLNPLISMSHPPSLLEDSRSKLGLCPQELQVWKFSQNAQTGHAWRHSPECVWPRGINLLCRDSSTTKTPPVWSRSRRFLLSQFWRPREAGREMNKEEERRGHYHSMGEKWTACFLIRREAFTYDYSHRSYFRSRHLQNVFWFIFVSF